MRKCLTLHGVLPQVACCVEKSHTISVIIFLHCSLLGGYLFVLFFFLSLMIKQLGSSMVPFQFLFSKIPPHPLSCPTFYPDQLQLFYILDIQEIFCFTKNRRIFLSLFLTLRYKWSQGFQLLIILT